MRVVCIHLFSTSFNNIPILTHTPVDFIYGENSYFYHTWNNFRRTVPVVGSVSYGWFLLKLKLSKMIHKVFVRVTLTQ